jgi:Flp pilus assembly protein TadD
MLVVGICGVGVYKYFGADAEALCRQAEESMERDPDGAETLLQRAIEQAGGRYPDAEVLLCLVAARRSDWSAAYNLLSIADTQSCRPGLLLELGLRANAAGKQPIARQALLLASERTPDNIETLEALLSVLRDRNDSARAMATVRTLLELEPDVSRWWFELGVRHESAHDRQAAVVAYRRAMELGLPQAVAEDARMRIISNLIETGDAVAARGELAHLAELPASNPALVGLLRARLHRLKGNPEQAFLELDKVIDRLGKLTDVIQLRGMLHMDVGNYQLAVDDLGLVIQQYPDAADVHFHLSVAYDQLQQTELARHHRDRYLESRTKEDDRDPFESEKPDQDVSPKP